MKLALTFLVTTAIFVVQANNLLPAGVDDPAPEQKTLNDGLDYINQVDRHTVNLITLLEKGAHDCYHQTISPDYVITFYAGIYYNPSDTGEKVEISIVDDINVQKLAEQEGVESFEYKIENRTGGTYSICFGNPRSNTAKLVQIYITYFRTHQLMDWVKADADLDQAHVQMATFMESIFKIETQIDDAVEHLVIFKKYLAKDQHNQSSNGDYVTRAAILQIILMLVIGYGQVYIVKMQIERDTPKRVYIRPPSHEHVHHGDGAGAPMQQQKQQPESCDHHHSSHRDHTSYMA